MSQPSKTILQNAHPFGAKVVAAPMTAGGAAVIVIRGDVVAHANPGWHTCVAPPGAQVVVPVGGLQENHSDDNFHWCQGPSYSASAVPQAGWTGSFDSPTSIGTDGRIGPNADGTYGGASGPSGSSGGSPKRGF
jgi:hypothetical protein